MIDAIEDDGRFLLPGEAMATTKKYCCREGRLAAAVIQGAAAAW
jgi:hypothetical protein